MSKKQEILKKGKPSKKKNASWRNACRSKMASEEDLMTLTTKQLRQCASEKEIQGRSKLKYKRDLVQALINLVTCTEVAQKKGITHPSPNTEPLASKNKGITLLKKKKVKKKKKIIRLKQKQQETLSHDSPKKLAIGNGARFKGHIMGVDVHSEELAYCIVNETHILKEGMLPNTPHGRKEIIALCQYFGVLSVAMESTADYWRRLYWDLTDHKIESLVANATQTKNTQGKKTDKFDAQRIAVAHRDGRLKPSICCSPGEFALRKALRHADKEIQLSTKYLNRIRAMQRMYSASKWVKKLHSSYYGRILLTTLPECENLADLEEEINQVRKPLEIEILHSNAKELWNFYVNLRKFERWNEFMREFSSYLHHKRQAEEHYRMAVQKAEKDQKFRESLEFLLTIPGIGFKSAAVIMSEIIDVSNFENSKALVRWAGLNPKVQQSGLRKNITGKITKKGNKFLRKTLFVCAQNEYAHGHHTGHPLGAKLRLMRDHEKKPYKKAIITGARKLLVWIWHMLTNKEQFKCDAPADVLEKLQKSGKRKINDLTRRIKTVTRQVEMTAEKTIEAIKEYEEVDTTIEFAQVVLRARNGEGSSKPFLPYQTLLGLSKAFLKINET